jgi:hypothetical protein
LVWNIQVSGRYANTWTSNTHYELVITKYNIKRHISKWGGVVNYKLKINTVLCK